MASEWRSRPRKGIRAAAGGRLRAAREWRGRVIAGLFIGVCTLRA